MGKPRSWEKPQGTTEGDAGRRAPQPSGRRFGMIEHGEFAVVVTQLVSYALVFGIVTSLGVLTPGGIVGSGLLAASMCMLMIVGWPFAESGRQSLFARFLSAAVFVAAVIFATQGDFYTDETFIRWARFLILALLAIVVVSFLRQMLRKDRSHLITSMSAGIMAACAALGASCWAFAPAFMTSMMSDKADSALGWGIFVVIVAAAVLLLVASTSWWKELDDPAPYAWMGMGMLPVMLLGYLVYVAAFLTHWAW